MYFGDPLADRIHDGDRHAVASLLVKLGIGIDGGSPVKHIIRKALQPPALTGCQFADASAAERHALIAGCVQRLRMAFPNTASAGITIGERQIDAVAAVGLRISGSSGIFDTQSKLAGIAGAEINAVLVLRIQAESRFAARLEAPSVLALVLPVGGKDGTAAIKNTGAFAPVADPDLVIACDQAFGVLLLQNFRITTLQLNECRFFGAVRALAAHAENAAFVTAVVGNAAVISCFDTAGVLGQPRFAFAQVDEIHPRASGKAAALAHQRTAYTCGVVNALALRAAD